MPQLAPPARPALADQYLVASDGARLPLRSWLPRSNPRAVIVALHGFNDYSNAFDGLGSALAWRGIATYAYDQRGFGAAPMRGLWPGTRVLAQDFAMATRLVRARHPGAKVYCLGESMGGAVVLAGLAGSTGAPPPGCDAAILLAPAVWGRQTMPFVERAALWFGKRLAPGMVLTGRGLHIKPSDNFAMLRRLSRDPMVLKGARIDTVAGLVDLMTVAFDAASKLNLPTLWLYGARDEIVPRRPTMLAVQSLPAEAASHQRVALYANGYHMLARDLEGAVIANDIASWIADPAAPLPSGADHAAAAALRGGVPQEPTEAAAGRSTD